MIFSIKGKIQQLSPTFAVVEAGGIGYYIGVSLQTSAQLSVGTEVSLYTQQIFREDAQLLFGFKTTDEKEMFNLLISVSGVGASSAMIILSSLSLQEISAGIQSGNSVLLQKVKGIGAKTAERIIVDLRDKVQKFGDAEANFAVANPVKDEALSALEVLGIPKKTSEKIAEKFIKANPEISVEDLVKQVLKNL